jgi:sarcosine oxidase
VNAAPAAHHHDAEVLVLGTGAWGAAALWRLAAAGVDVLGIDQHPVPTSLGSSHGVTRLFRTVCLEHPALTAIARRALGLYRELEGDTGTRLVDLCGGITIGPDRGRAVTGALASASHTGSPPQVLDAAELREHHPFHTRIAEGTLGVLDPEAGVLHIEDFVQAALTGAAAHGARHRTATVLEVARDPSGVRVVTTGGTFRARRAIAALGSWTPTVFPELPLKLTRMPMTWFPSAGDHSTRAGIDHTGVFIREIGAGGGYWGHGALPGGTAKIGPRGAVARGDEPAVASLDRRVRAEDTAPASAMVREYLPDLDPTASESFICHSSRSPDEQFLLGALPGNPAVIIAAGESGHGGKHSAAIGAIAADLARDRTPDLEIDFMDPARFFTT